MKIGRKLTLFHHDRFCPLGPKKEELATNGFRGCDLTIKMPIEFCTSAVLKHRAPGNIMLSKNGGIIQVSISKAL